MNDQLQQALALILGKATDAAMAGVSFLQAEIPDVVRQLLLWKLVWACVLGGLCLAVFLLWLVLGVKIALRIERNAKDYCNGDGWFGFVMSGFFFGVPPAIMLVWQIRKALLIWLAPKIYLIEYTAALVTGK